MDVLKAVPPRRRARPLAVAAVVALVAGCALFEAFQPERRSYAFSHRVHVVDQELGCTDCHLGAESEDEPGLPGLGACRLCHADLDAEAPPERKVETLFEGKEFRAARRGGLGPEIVFSHARHVASGLDCATCHAAIEVNDDVLELPPASMDDCTKCHAGRSVTDSCAACHPTILADVKPASHDGEWQRLHGPVCRAGAQRTADRCDLCHQESTCTTCHLTTMPERHTNHWRRFGHGLEASLDRASCATCHRSDSCNQCHAITEPRSHVGGFGSPMNRHCLTCHEPLRSQGCSTCHAGTPSHALAPPKPPDHSPAMNCRQCHGVAGGQPLPHVDNGDNCNTCHH